MRILLMRHDPWLMLRKVVRGTKRGILVCFAGPVLLERVKARRYLVPGHRAAHLELARLLDELRVRMRCDEGRHGRIRHWTAGDVDQRR